MNARIGLVILIPLYACFLLLFTFVRVYYEYQYRRRFVKSSKQQPKTEGCFDLVESVFSKEYITSFERRYAGINFSKLSLEQKNFVATFRKVDRGYIIAFTSYLLLIVIVIITVNVI